MSMVRYKSWMKLSTAEEKRHVAVLAATSLQMLYQLASEHRHASSELAGRIESAIAAVNKRKRETPLPVVRRGDISEACSKCQFYKKGDCK